MIVYECITPYNISIFPIGNFGHIMSNNAMNFQVNYTKLLFIEIEPAERISVVFNVS